MKSLKYKGYVAKTEIDVDSNLIFGEVIGSRDMVTFQGETVAEAVRAFHESVDLYLDICREHGLVPDRPYSGSIVVRTRPQVHRALMELAGSTGRSLNQVVDEVLTRAVELIEDRPLANKDAASMAPKPGSGGAV